MVIALLLEVLSGVSTLRGQTLAPSSLARLTRGTGIRLTLRDSAAPRFSGRIDSIAGDTLIVRSWTDSMAILPLDDVSSLETRVPGRNARQVGRTFFTIGAVAGVSMYVSWCGRNPELCRADLEPDPCDDYDEDDEDGEFSLPPLLTVMTFGTAAVLGGLAYALVPRRWEAIPLPVRVGIAPTSRGVLVYASLSFR